MRPVIMTIAGSDSGGGAGIQADLKTIAALGGYGTCAITALTAQNGARVRGIEPTPPDFVALQMETIEEGFPVAAAKTGMLFSADIITTVATHLAQTSYPLVVDPVCVSQSGAQLLEESAIQALIDHLLPRADLLTPNIPEAQKLAHHKISTKEDICTVGASLLNRVKGAVLIKGGHAPGENEVVDYLFQKNAEPLALANPRIHTPNNHGTGCTLSAAIATELAKKSTLTEAILAAQHYLNSALQASYTPGIGAGPVNHLWQLDQ